MSSVPRERLVDIGLVALLALSVVVPPPGRDDAGAAEVVVTLGLAIALTLARRRSPIPALALGLVATAGATAVIDRPTVLLPVCVILIYNVAVRTDRRTAIAAFAGGLVTFLVCIAILGPDDVIGPEVLAGVAWPTLAAAAGDASRSRSEVVAAAIERAKRAEVTRDQEGRRRVAEERLRIARELHDLVAHNIAVVSVQAGVAEHFLHRDPDAADAAIRQVRASAQAVLDELAGVLSVLRSDDDTSTPTGPTPTFDDLPDLVASFKTTGMTITFETAGEIRPLSAIATLAAYRTVQEALTNALKHGTDRTHLLVAYEPDRLRIVAENPVDATHIPTTPGWGYGLAGMKERVGAAGGTIDASESAGTFHLEVMLPYIRRAGSARVDEDDAS